MFMGCANLNKSGEMFKVAECARKFENLLNYKYYNNVYSVVYIIISDNLILRKVWWKILGLRYL